MGEVAGAAVGGQAAARRPGSQELLHQRLPAAAHRRCARASRDRRRFVECADGHRSMASERRQGYAYADLHVGMAFRSPGRTITDADLVAFAGLTGDYSELHTSDVYAKSSQFGRRVAHGMLGLAYAHGLMWARTGELRETAIAFLGISDWKIRRADLHRRHDLRRTTGSPSCATASRGRRRRSRRSTSRSSTRTTRSCSAAARRCSCRRCRSPPSRRRRRADERA